MATLRSGHRPVLLVVDVQVGVVAHAWDRDRIVGNVALAVQRAREAGVPVVWVQHADAQELPEGSADWQIVPELAPQPGDLHIHKQHNSSFEDTPLDAELARLGATHVVLAGAATNWCIRATAYGALDRGYDLTLVRDAHTTQQLKISDDESIAARDLVRDLNVAMTWLSYPGRSNATAAASALDFTAPPKSAAASP